MTMASKPPNPFATTTRRVDVVRSICDKRIEDLFLAELPRKHLCDPIEAQSRDDFRHLCLESVVVLLELTTWGSRFDRSLQPFISSATSVHAPFELTRQPCEAGPWPSCFSMLLGLYADASFE